MDMQEDPGAKSYQLHIRVQKPVVVRIGELGTFEFPAGEYVYTGSGKRNLGQRLSRHLSRSKRLRWHIDYLLSDPGVHVIGFSLSEDPECVINQRTTGEIVVLRFGATDCRNGCRSHLKFLGALRRSDGSGVNRDSCRVC